MAVAVAVLSEPYRQAYNVEGHTLKPREKDQKITKTVLHDAMTARHKNTLQNSAINHNSINTCTRRMALER